MYKKEVKLGNYSYTYYYYNIKIKGKVKNICLGTNKEKAREKIKEINKKRKKIRDVWERNFYKKIIINIILIMLATIIAKTYVVSAENLDSNALSFEPITDLIRDEDFKLFTINLQNNVFSTNHSKLTYNWTVSDTSIVKLGIVNNTGIATFTPQPHAFGSATITISAVDELGLSNSTQFTLTIKPVNDKPWVDLYSPEDNKISTTTNKIEFIYIPHDIERTIVNCTLIINDKIRAVDKTITPDAINTITTSLLKREYKWSVNCTDVENSIGNSQNRNLSIDYIGYIPDPGNLSGIDEVEDNLTTTNIQSKYPGMPDNTQIQTVVWAGSIGECWQPSSTLSERDIETTSYLLKMIPCPEIVKTENISKRVWCNGIEIDVEDFAYIRIGFLAGKTSFNMEFGKDVTYCPWCNNGVKDYDEEGVDCGPSCASCTKMEKPANIPLDSKCGDGKCQEDNKYICPEDCRNTKITLLLTLPLIVLLFVDIFLLSYYRKRGQLTKSKNFMLIFIAITLGGILIYIMARYFCASPTECESYFAVLALMSVTSAISLLMFRGTVIMKGIWKVLEYEGQESETEKIIKRIDSTIIKGKELMEKDVEAAEILYTTIQPLYEKLEEWDKKRVIKRIERFHQTISESRNRKNLNTKQPTKNKKRDMNGFTS